MWLDGWMDGWMDVMDGPHDGANHGDGPHDDNARHPPPSFITTMAIAHL